MTNFEKTKLVIRALSKRKLTGCEYAVCLYLLDELYGYKPKKVDSASYSHIANVTGFQDRQVIRAIKSLLLKGIILKTLYATKFGNAYHFNKPDLWQQPMTLKSHQVMTQKS